MEYLSKVGEVAKDEACKKGTTETMVMRGRGGLQ